jgi:GMP synthase-like glutamine amidotransferase
VFEWHGEVFDLPNESVPLAASAVAPLQAFRHGSRAYGLLFHVEIELSGIDSLCQECAPDLAAARVTAQEVKTAATPYLPALHQFADRLIGHLLPPKR